MAVPRHITSYPIRGFDCDPSGRLYPRTLFLMLQKSATAHAFELGVGVDLLIEQGIAWVLSQLRVTMDRWPTVGETITVETWPEAASRTRTDRRFRILDENGDLQGEAITLWLVMDLERRRPTRLPEFITSKLGRALVSSRPMRLDQIPALESPRNERRLTVSLSDLDMVHHANNAAFVEWMLECVAESLWNSHDPVEIEVHYLAECRLGETIASQCQSLDGAEPRTALHRLVRDSDGIEAARGRTLWRPSATLDR